MTKSNYTQLPKLYDEFNSKGFEVLAFPCNQFGAQEPGTHEEICQFVSKTEYSGANEKFHFFEKGDVNGGDAREVYKFLTEALPRDDGSKPVGWNFEIFLVDSAGEPYKRFVPSRTPYDLLKPHLEKLLS